MQDKYYSALRHFFFWLFSFLFILFSPVVVFYSLGYKFDVHAKKFLKTGAINIKIFPKGVDVYLDDKKIEGTAPLTIRELLPRKYSLTLVKEGFYPYKLATEIKPSSISNIDVFLIPKIEDSKKIESDLHIYRFFVAKHLFGEKIITFTDKGIYLLDEDFKGARLLSSQIFDETEANSIAELKENNGKIVFWNNQNIWMLASVQSKDEERLKVLLIYNAQDAIKDVFLGLKERYFIIHDGLKIIALDADNPQVYFPIYELKSMNAKVFYNSRNETIYIKDKLPGTKAFSLFKIEMMMPVSERIASDGKEN